MKVHILDANALYRFVKGGPGDDVVAQLFKQARDAEQPLRMSIVNWGEVYYTIARTEGFAEATTIMNRVRLLPLLLLDANEDLTVRAAKLKAGHGLPYADCFAAALTGKDQVLVTSDVKDFKKIRGLHIVPLPGHKAKG